MMRKIIVSDMISVDGYFTGLDGNIDWHNVDTEFNEYAVEQQGSVDTMILGRTTFDLFESYWPKALVDPKTSKEDRIIARQIEDMTKIVFTKTLEKTDWAHTRLLKEINPEEIRKWKEAPGKDMIIYGSGTIVQAFANLDLIDEYRLYVNAVILGQGKPLFKDVKKLKLKLLKTKTFGNGNVLLSYEPLR